MTSASTLTFNRGFIAPQRSFLALNTPCPSICGVMAAFSLNYSLVCTLNIEQGHNSLMLNCKMYYEEKNAKCMDHLAWGWGSRNRWVVFRLCLFLEGNFNDLHPFVQVTPFSLARMRGISWRWSWRCWECLRRACWTSRSGRDTSSPPRDILDIARWRCNRTERSCSARESRRGGNTEGRLEREISLRAHSKVSGLIVRFCGRLLYRSWWTTWL